MKSKLFLSFVFILVFATSCKKQAEEFQFTLQMEYTGTTYNCKTFSILIDGAQMLNAQLCYQGLTPNTLSATIPITAGKHTMQTIVSEDSKTFSEVVEFSTTKKFGYLTYNSTTHQFTFTMDESGLLI